MTTDGSTARMRHAAIWALCVTLAPLVAASDAAAQAVPAENEVVLFDGPNYTTLSPNGRRVVALDPAGNEIQHVATFGPGFAFQSILVGSTVAAYVYAYDPGHNWQGDSHWRAPILQSTAATSGLATMVVVGSRYAIGPLNADNPMRIVFEARFSIAQADSQVLERAAFPIRYGSAAVCEDASAIAGFEPHVLEVWSGSRPQSEVELYLYAQPGCTGQGVHHVGQPGGIPMPPPGFGGPVRSFIARYTGPMPYTRQTQGSPGQAVPPSPGMQTQTTPYEVVPPMADTGPQNPVQPPQQAPGGWVAPFIDLAGRWQFGGTGEILDFALVPGTAEFVTTSPGFRASMVMLPSGRVRLDITAEGGPVTTEGDLIVQGPQGHESYTIVFDPPPGDSRYITINRLN